MSRRVTLARGRSHVLQTTRRRLGLETLEPKQLLAVVAISDNYVAVEDTTFNSTSLAASTVVPMGSLWMYNDELTREANAYPTDSGARHWAAIDYDYGTATPAWDGPAPGPFDCRPPFCDMGVLTAFANVVPFTNVDVSQTSPAGPPAGDNAFVARHEFTLDGSSASLSTGLITYTCDSGCAFWINGVEAGRSPSMATVATLTPNAFAVGGGDEDLPHATLSVSFGGAGQPALIAGTNVFAVEVHQDSTTSSDVGFDAELTLTQEQSLIANDLLAGQNGPLMITLDVQATDTLSGRPAGSVLPSPITGHFAFTPAANYPNPLMGDGGEVRFDYTITDNDGPSTTTVFINVTPVSDPPVAANDDYYFAGNFLVTDPYVGPEYVAAGSNWFYSDNGSDQPTENPTWNHPGFNPSTASGWNPTAAPAQLGYGEGDEATTIDCGPAAGNECTSAVNTQTNKYITSYFQRTFDIVGTIPSMLQMGLVRDDGAIVYINGVEVHRTASLTACAAEVTYLTLATCSAQTQVGGADESRFFLSAFPTANLNLQATGNVIAVEIHQQATNSTDVSFNLRLSSGMVGLVSNDTDVDDAPEQLNVEVVDQSAITPAVGTLNVASNGTFAFTPANSAVGGDFSFTYRVVDSGGARSNTATVTLHITPGSTCAFDADLDNDGDVDRVDLAAFTRQYSSAAGSRAADINCDSRVTLDDLLEMKRRYGLSAIDVARAPGVDNIDGSLQPSAVDEVLSSRNDESLVIAVSTRAKRLFVERTTTGAAVAGVPHSGTTPAVLRARRHMRATSSVRAE